MHAQCVIFLLGTDRYSSGNNEIKRLKLSSSRDCLVGFCFWQSLACFLVFRTFMVLSCVSILKDSAGRVLTGSTAPAEDHTAGPLALSLLSAVCPFETHLIPDDREPRLVGRIAISPGQSVVQCLEWDSHLTFDLLLPAEHAHVGFLGYSFAMAAEIDASSKLYSKHG